MGSATVSGTWCWPCYAGACCDVDNLEYAVQFSASLQQEWH